MADKYQSLVSGRETMVEATVVSAGAGNAGEIPALDGTGKLDLSVMPVGVGPATAAILASENLAAGDFVNVYDNAGTQNVRKADASNDRRANGFVLAAVTSGNNATVYFEGQNTQLSGLTPGARQYLGAGGAPTETVPVLPGSVIHQFLGTAISATAMDVEMADEIVL